MHNENFAEVDLSWIAIIIIYYYIFMYIYIYIYIQKVLRIYSFIRRYLFQLHVTSGWSRLAVDKGFSSYREVLYILFIIFIKVSQWKKDNILTEERKDTDVSNHVLDLR